MSSEYINGIKKFFYNKRHIEAIVLVVIFLIILAFAINSGAGTGKGSSKGSGGATGDAASSSAGSASEKSSSGRKSKTKYKKEQQGSDLHDLLTEYYKDYADGDTDAITKIADPVSDMEKSYIKFMSGLIDSYDISEIYTKDGADNKSKLVSVYVQMHFKGLKSAAPGLDFFYVQQDDSGALRINNLYSSFNQTNKENAMDPEVVSAIASFEEQQDVVDLQTKVQKEYNEISLSDKDFAEFMTKTYPDKVKEWQSDYRKDAKKQEEKEKKEEQEKEKKEKEEKKKEDEKKKEKKDDKKSKTKKMNKTVMLKETVNIRKKPDTKADRLSLAYAGEKVTITEQRDDGWSKVKYKGKTGYIKSEFLK